jgi:hypothetical protein
MGNESRSALPLIPMSAFACTEEIYRAIWPQHSLHAASFAVMPRWGFIRLGIFYEMVALEIRSHVFSSLDTCVAV